MSKTDKDVPWSVRRAREGEVHHDHSRGPCSLDNPNARDWRVFSAHRRVCAKRVTEVPTCTKAEPVLVFGFRRDCWKNEYVRHYHPDTNLLVAVERTWIQCVGHKEVTRYDESIACECDSWVRETCEVWGSKRTRTNREKGRGDMVEYSTPRSRQLATVGATRKAIAEGIVDWEIATARHPGACGVCGEVSDPACVENC